MPLGGAAFDFTPYAPQLWPPLLAAVRRLPRAVLGGHRSKPPALLVFVHALSSHPNLLPMLLHAPSSQLPPPATNTSSSRSGGGSGGGVGGGALQPLVNDVVAAAIACLSAGTGGVHAIGISGTGNDANNNGSKQLPTLGGGVGGLGGGRGLGGGGAKAVRGASVAVLELVLGLIENLLQDFPHKSQKKNEGLCGRDVLRPLLPALIGHFTDRYSSGLTGGTKNIEMRQISVLCQVSEFAIGGGARRRRRLRR